MDKKGASHAKEQVQQKPNHQDSSRRRIRHANGYKPKTLRTRIGEITFAEPQVREGGFYPSALEKGMRRERALVAALVEMYMQGVLTRQSRQV